MEKIYTDRNAVRRKLMRLYRMEHICPLSNALRSVHYHIKIWRFHQYIIAYKRSFGRYWFLGHVLLRIVRKINTIYCNNLKSYVNSTQNSHTLGDLGDHNKIKSFKNLRRIRRKYGENRRRPIKQFLRIITKLSRNLGKFVEIISLKKSEKCNINSGKGIPFNCRRILGL